MAVTAPPTWQMRIGASIWSDFDAATSHLFEAAFVTGATHIVEVSGRISGPSVTQDFDVRKMEWGTIPVRRTARDSVPTCVEFWDDDAWVPFDAYAQCLLGTAMAVGREQIAIHVGNASYDINLTPGNCMQTNRASGRSRPLRVNGSIASVQGDDDEDDDDIKDDPAMPNEYRCPITQMPMKKPVMMCDGHSYECQAIQKWLLKKQTSPVTGKTLATTMTVNHALKKLVRDWNSTGVAMAVAATSGASAAKRAAEEEDLFGSSDDDEAQPADAAAMAAAGPYSLPGSFAMAGPSQPYAPKKRMKSMSKI